jgi:hypothetical protein
MIIIQNPWSLTPQFEAQRTDLWRLDMRQLSDMVQNPTGVDRTAEYEQFRKQAVQESADFFVQRVLLPEVSIEGRRVIIGTQYSIYPGYDEPVAPIRIDFFHEATGNEFTGGSGLNSSRIYCLLTCWMMLAMSGQRRYNRVQLPLINAKSKPSFKADLTLNLFRGSEDGETLGDGAIYLIKDCWISDLQIMECDHSRTGDHASITATIQAGAVVPRPL